MIFHIRFIFVLFFLSLISGVNAQEYTWEKDYPGTFLSSGPSPVKNFKAKEVFDIFNQLPFITRPKGFDVKEVIMITKEESQADVYSGNLIMSIKKYYRYHNGPIEKSEGPGFKIKINNRNWLMNTKNQPFGTELDQLHLPPVFTDTFPVRYETINGYMVGTAFNLEFGGSKMFILNPRRKALFVQLTKEQFLKVWISKLELEIKETSSGLEESRQTVKSMASNLALKSTMEEMEKINRSTAAWIDFLKEKRAAYEKKLQTMTVAEKALPAFYSMPKEVALRQDSHGKYFEKISGHLPYEPDEGVESFETRPIYIFNPSFYDPNLPKTAFQLMIILYPFDTNSTDELKTTMDENLFSKINYKALAELMY
jgi:hypothetical protein